MRESIFSRLFRYKETPNMRPEENFLTEMLSWMVDTLPQFGRDYVRFLCDHCESGVKPELDVNDSIHSKTQITVKSGYIDMVITTEEKVGFICEHKVNSELSDDQIGKYYDCREEIDPDADFKTVILTKKSSQHTQEADVQITWHEIYVFFAELIKKGACYSSERIMIEEFLMYLTEVGMGKHDEIRLESVEQYCEVTKLPTKLRAIFCDLKDELMRESECSGLRSLVPDFDPQVPYMRWGRVGIDFAKTWEKEGAQSIFAGVVLENFDHKLQDWNETPELVVLIDCRKKLGIELRKEDWFKRIEEHVNAGESTDGFRIETNPKNTWRMLILKKPLLDVLKHDDYDGQKEDIKAEIIRGINFILKYYNT